MIKARKSLGQNFLSDERVALRIVEAVAPEASDIIIEIGPGAGALTRHLADRSGYVVAIEIDPRLIGLLRELLPRNNVMIVEADAMTVDFEELITSATQSFRMINDEVTVPGVRVVANLPYYISTPIIEKLLASRHLLSDLTLMLQKEVVDRITSPPGSREYGYLSVAVQFYCEATKLFEVPPSAFKPAPKVDSAVLRLKVRKQPAVRISNEQRFISLVSAAFAQRRKTIANNLKAASVALKFDNQIEAALRDAGIEARRRAETLSLEEFGALYRSLYNE